MKQNLYKIGAAVFVAVFVTASFGFSTQAAEKKMTQDEPVEITMQFDKTTGKLLKIQPKNAKSAELVPNEKITEILNSKKGFRYVATFLHSHSSPGCTYY